MSTNLNRHRQPRRGMAMLLVIVSLMMATILTTSYLASRDNSDMIGSNISGGAGARAAALSGLDMAAAMMQTQTNWRTADPHGMLLSEMPVGGGDVSVEARDELTQLAPTSTTEYVFLTSTAQVNGVEEVATARAYVPLSAGNTVDVDLSEFAVFVGTHLDMTNHATITRWPNSPLTKLGSRLALGTRSTSSASIVMSDTSGTIDGTVYTGPGASSSLVSISGGPALKTVSLKDLVPLPAAPNVGLAASVATPVPADMTMSGGTATAIANARYRNAEIKNNAVRTFQGNLRIVTERDLKINSGGKIIVNGNVKLAVFGDLIMDQGAIELTPTSTLSLYVRGSGSSTSCRIKDSYIGDSRTNNLRDNTGNASYFNPARIALYSMTPTGTVPDWQIEGNSVVKGSIYCPEITLVRVRETSAVYGRVATKSLEMRDDAAVFYDPMLNSRSGYTNSTSPLFDASGNILAGYKTLASLDTSSIQAVADLYSTIVKSVTVATADITPTTGIAPVDDGGSGGGGSVTARPVKIQYELLTLSSDVRKWETGSNCAAAVQVATSANLMAN